MKCNKCGYDDKGTGSAHYCRNTDVTDIQQILRRIEQLEKQVAHLLEKSPPSEGQV